MSPIRKGSRGTSRVARVSKNAALLIGAKFISSGLSFFLVIAINRELGPLKAGIFAYAFAMYAIFMIVPDFGLGSISVRDVSQDHTKIKHYFKNIVMIRSLMGLGAFLVLVATDFVGALVRSPLSFDQKFWTVFAVAFCLLLEQPLSNSLAETFIALERMTTVAFVYTIMAIVRVALSMYILFAFGANGQHQRTGSSLVLVLLVLVYILTLVYSIIHFYISYRRMLKRVILPEANKRDLALAETIIQSPKLAEGAALDEALVADYSYSTMREQDADRDEVLSPEESSNFRIGPLELDTELWRYLMRSAWPLAVIVAGITLYVYMDIPLLSWIRGDTEVGLYNAGAMFAKSALYISLGLNMAVLPAISVVAKKHMERLGEIWERMLKYMFSLSALLAVVVPILARPIMIVQKHDFIAAWPVVWITMAAIMFSSLTAVSFPYYIAVDKQKKATLVVLLGIIFKLILLPIAIPLWGYTGAAVTLVITEIANFFLYYRVLSPELKHRIRWLHTFGAPVACLGITYTIAFVLQWVFIHGNASAERFLASLLYAVITTAAVLVVFAGLLFITKIGNRKDLSELNEMLKVD